MIKLIFRDGEEMREVMAEPGQTLLVAAQGAGIDLEGACGGQLACATCHLYVGRSWRDKLPKMKPDEAEMLELAPHWRPTSRLGCQIVLHKGLDGLELELPPI